MFLWVCVWLPHSDTQVEQSVVTVQIRLDKTKPTIYVTFERRGVRQPLTEGESDQGIWLRLHNNSVWPIHFASSGIATTDKKTADEAGIIYDVEIVGKYAGDSPPGGNRFHTYSIRKLSSGESIVFGLPSEHLSTGLAISVTFIYDWEMEKGRPNGKEPKHQVYFYSYDLPKE